MLQDEMIEAVVALDEERCIRIAKELLVKGYSNQEIASLLNEGVKKIGAAFAEGDLFLGDLIVSGMLYRSVMDLCPPSNSGSRSILPFGRVVIGVAEDDIHDIGKDIIVSQLRAEGFEVIDLGVDVKSGRFIHAVETYRPDVLLICGMMNFTEPHMKETIRILAEKGLRDSVAVMVGGGVVSSNTLPYTGADAATQDPIETLHFCIDTVTGKKAGPTAHKDTHNTAPKMEEVDQ